MSLLTACAIRYNSEEEFRQAIRDVVHAGQTSGAATAALQQIGFTCRPGLGDSSLIVCLRDAQGFPCMQYQGVDFPASSPSIGTPNISLGHVCL